MTMNIETSPPLDYKLSQDYRDDMEAIHNDPVLATRLTLRLLENIALDCKAGTTVEDFLGPDSKDGVEFVNLRIHRTANFIPAFSLSRSSDEFAQLREAVKVNLESSMFRAANISRRLEASYTSREARWSRLAYKAYGLASDKANAACPRSHFHRTREDVQAIVEASNRAYDAVYRPLEACYKRRLASLEQLRDRTPMFDGAFPDIAANFVRLHVRGAADVKPINLRTTSMTTPGIEDLETAYEPAPSPRGG